MKNKSLIGLIAATLLLCSFGIINAINWQIKDGYAIKFSGSSASGKFEKVKGAISFDDNDLASSYFLVDVEVSSIATGNWLKNSHAKGEKWFNADKYPTINFTSTKFLKTAKGYSVDGILTMHGIKKPINIPFTFSNNIFSGSFSVKRIDYGIGTMEGMSKKVSNDMKIDILVPVSKK